VTLVRLTFKGKKLEAYKGEPLTAALIRAGYLALGQSRMPGQGQRGTCGAFCFMGVCQECRVIVDGKLAQACRTFVETDMQVLPYDRL